MPGRYRATAGLRRGGHFSLMTRRCVPFTSMRDLIWTSDARAAAAGDHAACGSEGCFAGMVRWKVSERNFAPREVARGFNDFAL